MIPDVLKGFIALTLIFVPLERLWSVQSRPVLRRQWATDVFYYFSGYFVGRLGTAICAVLAMGALSHIVSPDLRQTVANQPLGWQFAEAVLIGEVGYYTAHRLQHTVPWLWQFHAIHHSAESLDWLITVRMHPLDQLMAKIMQVLPLYLLGFSPQLFVVYALFSAAMAFFIHANLRGRFGWFNWVLATPEFHRWHHANQPGLYDKNFAAHLPIMDWLFGSFYLPRASERQLPLRYGVRELVPSGYLNHLVYPFPRVVAMLKPNIRKLPRWVQLVLRPLPLCLLLAIVAVGSITGMAAANHLSLPMFLSSLDIPRVTVTQLKQGQVLGKSQRVILLDVRSPEEYNEDHIAGSVWVPITDIEAGFGVDQVVSQVRAIAQTAPTQPQPTLVIYCATGPRSIRAYNALAKTGLPMAVLQGGFDGWRSQIPASQDREVLTSLQMPR